MSSSPQRQPERPGVAGSAVSASAASSSANFTAGKEVSPDVMEELLSMRASIDNIDATLVYLLAERFKATQRVGVLKASHELPAADPDREKRQISRLKRLAEDAQLDPEFAEKFLNFIIEEVIRHHQALSSSSGSQLDNSQHDDTQASNSQASDSQVSKSSFGGSHTSGSSSSGVA